MIRLRLHVPGRCWTASTGQNAGRSAWPPAPWTVLAGLVNGAHLSGNPAPGRAVIDTLARADDPVLWLPTFAPQQAGPRFVGPTGPQPASAHHTHLDASRAVPGRADARTKHLLVDARGEMSSPVVLVDWPDVDLSPTQCEELADAARATPYVGRATDETLLGVLSWDGDRWWDHTAGMPADPDLSEPGPDHERHVPTRLPGPVRCPDGDFLAVCDDDHQRREQGLPGVPASRRGRGVRYQQTTGGGADAVVLVLSGRRDARTVLAELDDVSVFLLGSSRRPWAVWFPDATTAAETAARVPHLFTGDEPRPRHVEPWYGTPAARWRTVSPVVAHPNRRRAAAELAVDLAAQVHLTSAGSCPELPHLTRWHVTALLDQPVAGPLQAGDGQMYGYGRFRKDTDQ